MEPEKVLFGDNNKEEINYYLFADTVKFALFNVL
jgi:hypothetical protein